MTNTDIFSDYESKVLKVVAKRKKMTVTEIAERIFGDKANIDHNNRIAGVIRRINRKCENYKLPWFLNGAGRGRGGKTVWKDKRA